MAKRITDIDPELVRKLLDYDPETGVLTWKLRENIGSPREDKIFNTQFAGKPTGSINYWGYLRVAVFKKLYYAHRLAWVVHHGYWPYELDHINGVRTDNRLANLRECKHHENSQNFPKRADNKSGHVGTYYDKRRNRWYARIVLHGKCLHLGAWNTAEEAGAAYNHAKTIHHTFQPTVRAS